MTPETKGRLTVSKERIKEIEASEEYKALVRDIKKNAPPLEVLAPEEIASIEEACKVLAAKAESYYLGYMRGNMDAGGEVADAGVTIVASTAGAAVGTAVGQIVGKKMDGAINTREHVINPETFNILDM